MSTNKKVLYISYDGMTDPLGQSQVIPYLQKLALHGYQFTVLSVEKKSRFIKEAAIVRKLFAQANIEWRVQIFTKHPPIISKIYDRWKLKRKAFKLFRKNEFQMTHCRSYITAEVGLALKKRYGVKFLFDMRGFWADEKVDNGQWDMKKFLFRKVYKHYKNLEREFLNRADGIVSLTEAAKNELLKKQEFNNLKIDVIPCCADLDHFNYHNIDSDSTRNLKIKLGIHPEAKVITYVGSIGGWYMTDEMLVFFGQLLKKYNDFVILMLTKDDPEIIIKQAVKNEIPGDKLFVHYSIRRDMPAYINLSNCSIFFIRPTYSKIASSPTKHAEIMAMGIPVICNDIGDTASIVKKTDSGLVVHGFTKSAYEEVIDKIPQLLTKDRERIRQFAFEYFDLEKGVGTYLKLYKEILNK